MLRWRAQSSLHIRPACELGFNNLCCCFSFIIFFLSLTALQWKEIGDWGAGGSSPSASIGCMQVESHFVLPITDCLADPLKRTLSGGEQPARAQTSTKWKVIYKRPCMNHSGGFRNLEGGLSYWRAKHVRKCLIATPTSGHAGSPNWIFRSNSRPGQASGDQ